MNYLIMMLDTNDADYVKEISKISDEDLKLIKPLIKAIKNFKPYKTKIDGLSWTHNNNFPYGDGEYIPREDLGEKTVDELYKEHIEALNVFKELCPYNVHTIKSIKLIEVAKEIKLL